MRVAQGSVCCLSARLGLPRRAGYVGFSTRHELLSEWLTDERDEVRKFAEKHIAAFDLRIAADQRLAEAERAMYVRDFGSDSEEPSGRDTSA